jgi:cell division protein FtsQ
LRRYGLPVATVAMVFGGVGWFYQSGRAADLVAGARSEIYRVSARAGFSVNDILVEGRLNSDPDVLRAILNLERGDPILAFNPAEARDMIERISWVKEAHVERRFPSTIYIGLVERLPMALWQNKGKIRVVDSDGVTLTDSLRHNFNDLPIIVGENAPRHAPFLLGVLAEAPLVRERMEAATWVGDRRWDLKLKSGVVVKLPESDMGMALRRLADAHAEDGILDRDILMIDLREDKRMTVQTRPGAVEEYRKQLKAATTKGNNI